MPASVVAAEWLKKKPYPSIAKSARRRDLQPNLEKRFEKHFTRGSFVDVPDLRGQRPPALREAVLLRMGRELIALHARTSEELYRIPFDRYDPRGPLVLVNDRLLAVTDREVFSFDAATGRALGSAAIPGNGKGLSLLEHRGQVFLLFRQRGLHGRVGVAALHPEDVSATWTTIIRTENRRERINHNFTIGDRDRLLLFSEQPARVTVINTTSGAIENRIPLGGEGLSRLAVPPKLLPDGRVLVGLLNKKKTQGFAYQLSYSVHLIDPALPAERAEAWPAFTPPPDKENRYLHLIHVIGQHVVTLDDACGAAVLDLRTGKTVKWVERLPIGDPNQRRRPQLTANQAVHDLAAAGHHPCAHRPGAAQRVRGADAAAQVLRTDYARRPRNRRSHRRRRRRRAGPDAERPARHALPRPAVRPADRQAAAGDQARRSGRGSGLVHRQGAERRPDHLAGGRGGLRLWSPITDTNRGDRRAYTGLGACIFDRQ